MKKTINKMAGIKSTKEMIYDARSSDSGMIEVDILGWTYEPNNNRYSVRTVDYVLSSQVSSVLIPGLQSLTYSYPVRTTISQKDVIYTREKMDSLFVELGNPIDVSESFTDDIDAFISQALLIVIQEDPIYRDAATGQVSLPSDWVLYEPGTASNIP